MKGHTRIHCAFVNKDKFLGIKLITGKDTINTNKNAANGTSAVNRSMGA